MMFVYRPLPNLYNYVRSSRSFHRYYKHTFYTMGETYNLFFDARDWCEERYGHGLEIESVITTGTTFTLPWAFHVVGETVYLREDNDAFEFRMRWC